MNYIVYAKLKSLTQEHHPRVSHLFFSKKQRYTLILSRAPPSEETISYLFIHQPIGPLGKLPWCQVALQNANGMMAEILAARWPMKCCGMFRVVKLD